MARVLIIGGGVIGLSIAHYAVRKGHEVVVVDRRQPEDSCAVGSAGMVTPSHFIPLAAPGMVGMGLRMMWNSRSPFYIKPRFDTDLFKWGYHFWRASTQRHVDRSAPLLLDLNLKSRLEFDQFAADCASPFDFVKAGLLMLCKTEEGLHEEEQTAAKANSLGLRAEILDKKGIERMEPGAQMNVKGGVYFPMDCHLSPDRYMDILKTKCQDAGVVFHMDTEITGWKRNGSKLVAALSHDRRFEADEFVLAAGSWAADFGKELGVRIPLQPGKGYSVTLPQSKVILRHCAILTEARVAVTPMGPRLRFGGTMELAGHDGRVNPERIQGIIDSVLSFYPEFKPEDFQNLPPWHGFRPCTPDGLPYLGRSAATPNLIVAAGHAMMGLSLAPITGKLVTELISGDKLTVDISLLNPDRYG